MAKRNTNGNRYPGVDSTPWTVKDATGKPIKHKWEAKGPATVKLSPNFAEVKVAAARYTYDTGLFAQAVRA